MQVCVGGPVLELAVVQQTEILCDEEFRMFFLSSAAPPHPSVSLYSRLRHDITGVSSGLYIYTTISQYERKRKLPKLHRQKQTGASVYLCERSELYTFAYLFILIYWTSELKRSLVKPGTMPVYCKTTEDIESGQPMTAGDKSSGSWFWKLCSLLSLLAVCAVVALLFTWHIQKQEQKLPEIPAPSQTGETDHQQTLKQIAGNVKAGIHVAGYVNSEYNSQLEWSVMDGHSFSQGGLTLKNNEIVIPYTGMYFVYSQASFRVQCSASADPQDPLNLPLSHTVMRYSESYGEGKTLLSTVKSPCVGISRDFDSSDRVFSSIYLGAGFKLQRGDRLWTETNRLGDIDTDEGKTFFGVFAL